MLPSVYDRFCSDAFLCVHAGEGLYLLIPYLGLIVCVCVCVHVGVCLASAQSAPPA